MNMHKFIPIIFSISALITLILCSACTMLPPENQTSQTGNLSQVSQPVESPYINFDVALNNLPANQLDPENATFTKTIYYIVGIDIDESGNARNWIFGVRLSDGTGMLGYDGKSWTTIPWKAPTDLEEIPVDKICFSGTIIQQERGIDSRQSSFWGS